MDVLVNPTPAGAEVALGEQRLVLEWAEVATLSGRPDLVDARFVWADTATTYPHLLRHHVRVGRCHDLRLSRQILDHATSNDPSTPPDWLTPHDAPEQTLLDEPDPAPSATLDDLIAEVADQRSRTDHATDPGKLRLLLAAESAGALIAAEMAHDGMPWSRSRHDEILTEALGPRPPHGFRPRELEALAVVICEALEAPRLVVADAAQIEPRCLAAMARDEALATAGRGNDLYQGLVDSGVVDTRAHAKVGMLSALYGGTAGEAGVLGPRLKKAYPTAVGLVDDAARAGERGLTVRTWLGRTSPPPSERWFALQQDAREPGASPDDQRRARSWARDWGRFTRNFVVQGTAAEWAICWMADLRQRLARFPAIDVMAPGQGRPHLVFFLHDEIMVHTPADLADEVAVAVQQSAETAGRLLFGTFPITFPLDVAVVEGYDEAE